MATPHELEALSAVQAFLRSRGLSPVDGELTSVSAHAVITFPEFGLVAKATRDYAADLKLEASVLACLVDAPAPRLAFGTGTHQSGEWTVLWMRLIEHGGEVSPEAAARALSDVHAALQSVSADLPTWVDVYGNAWHLLHNFEKGLRGELTEACRKYVEPLIAGQFELQVVHGDAHLNNVLATSQGPVWIDYEKVRVAPLEYDLAMLDDPSGYPEFNRELWKRFYRARLCENTIWAFDAAARDARWLDRAQHSLGVVRAFD